LTPGDVPYRYDRDGSSFTLSQLAGADPADQAEASLGEAIANWGPRLSDADLDWHVVDEGDGRVLAMALGG
jgi:hypothetical protein